MNTKIWKQKTVPDQALVDALTSELNAPELIAKMLVQRGIDSPEKVRKFFNPRIGDMHDPFLMKDMDKAIERIQMAQENKEGVLIFGDYDVDVKIGDCYKHKYYGTGRIDTISPNVDFPIEMFFQGHRNKHFSIHGEEYNNERNENLIRFPMKKIEKKVSVNDIKIDVGYICSHPQYGTGEVKKIYLKGEYPIEVNFPVMGITAFFSIKGKEFRGATDGPCIDFSSPERLLTETILTTKEVEDCIKCVISKFEKTTGVLITDISVDWLCNTDHRKNQISADISNIQIRSRN
jgi:hypothetical protein